MMQTGKNVLFLILIERIVYFAAFAADKESLSRSAYFTTHENRRLKGHVVKRFASPSLMSCSKLCLTNSWCTSTNFKISSKEDGKGTCELNKHDISVIYEDNEFHDQEDVTFLLLLKSPCMSGPCQNGGSCVSIYEKNSYLCICVKGYTGSICQTDIDDCASQPCKNHGTCTDQVNGFTCSCAPGFNGTRCEIDIDDCASHPCKNNGTCIDRVNGFNCTCAPGFNGTQCETGLLPHYSTILAGNAFYQSHLNNFLAPAVGFNSYWVLCYRASTHGWAASTFHSRCDGKRDTVTIIKVGEYVFGGYTDIPWDSDNSVGSTSNAFIFSLRNKEGLGPFKSSVMAPSSAIYRASSYGPVFGVNDIRIADNANSNNDSVSFFGWHYSVPSGVQNSDTILAGTQRFTPDEVEVFYLD